MKGVVMQIPQYQLNESFKALVAGIFDNEEQTQRLVKAFEEVVNDRATTEKLNLEVLKRDLIEEARKELVTKEGQEAELARLKNQLVTKADLYEILKPYATKEDIAKVRQEIANTKADLLKWIIGAQVAITGVALTILKFMLAS